MIGQWSSPQWPEFLLQHWGVFAHHMHSVLLSAVLITIFTCAEFIWSTPGFGGLWGRAVNIAIGLIVGVVVFFCVVFLGQVINLMPFNGLASLFRPQSILHGALGLATAVLAYGLVWDFFQYWFHRAQHTFATLWPSHRVHHSDSAVNTTTALRRSVAEALLIFIFVLLPTVVIVGVHKTAAPIAFAIFYGWGFFNHANIRLSLGPLTALFSGPAWHRLHHALEPEYRDCNFAAYFPLLDIVFGTYRPPRVGENAIHGIADQALAARPFQDCLLPRWH